MSREEAEAEDSKKKSDDMRLQMAIQKSKENDDGAKEEKKPQSALSDLVDLNFGGPTVTTTGPHPPQRTAASRDPWSPMAENGSSGGSQDPWGGMGPIISSSTIPDPWGGIGGVGVPPSRGSPLVFGAATSTSPPAGKTNPDPWSAPAPAPSNNDPWGEAPAKGEEAGQPTAANIFIIILLQPTLSLPADLAIPTTSWLHLEELEEPPTPMEDLDPESVQCPGLLLRRRPTPGTWEDWTHSLSWGRTTCR